MPQEQLKGCELDLLKDSSQSSQSMLEETSSGSTPRASQASIQAGEITLSMSMICASSEVEKYSTWSTVGGQIMELLGVHT